MATAMPIAVATSASEMLYMTIFGATEARHLRISELVERGHDADDRSEQPDERRVVSERAEKGEPLLQTIALERARAGHRFFRRLDAVLHLTKPAITTAASALGDASSRRRAPSRSAFAQEPCEIAHERRNVGRGGSSRARKRSSMIAIETTLRITIKSRIHMLPKGAFATTVLEHLLPEIEGEHEAPQESSKEEEA